MIDMDQIANSLGKYFALYAIVAFIIIIIHLIAQWKIFTKANEKGWKSIIPIYNTFVLYKISGISPWLYVVIIICGALSAINNSIIVLLALLIVIIINVYQNYSLAKSFGKGLGYTLGLLFLNTIFVCILGFGNAKYDRQK